MRRPPAIVCSAHGFGHVTRQLVVAGALRARGVDVELFTAAPAALIDETFPGARVRPWQVDVGIAQPDSLHEDLDQTLVLLDQRCGDSAIDTLADKLADRPWVIVDIAPAGLEAARRAGVPALAVGNFDWAWVYHHYPPLQRWAERFATWQAPHPAIQLWPGPGLHGFAKVTPAGLLGRRAPARRVAAGRTVLVSFGGFGLADLDAALPRVAGVTWVLAPPSPRLPRDDCAFVDDAPYPSLVAGADAVFTKPGYGIFAEASLAGTPIAWVARGAFPEAPSLVAALHARGDVEIAGAPTDDGFAAALERALRTLWSRPRPPVVTDKGALDVILDAIAALSS